MEISLLFFFSERQFHVEVKITVTSLSLLQAFKVQMEEVKNHIYNALTLSSSCMCSLLWYIHFFAVCFYFGVNEKPILHLVVKFLPPFVQQS